VDISEFVCKSDTLPDGSRILIRSRSRMRYRCPSPVADKVVDLCFAEKSNPVVIGIRLVGFDDYRQPNIECALIGVLNYADEDKRTVADVIEV